MGWKGADMHVRNLGAWGGGEEGRGENSERAGPSSEPQEPDTSTSPPASHLYQNQSHVWACYEENLPNPSQLGGC